MLHWTYGQKLYWAKPISVKNWAAASTLVLLKTSLLNFSTFHTWV